jgi:hypothetical protein
MALCLAGMVHGDPCGTTAAFYTTGRAHTVVGACVDPRDGQHRDLRLVTLENGETIHNAFFDRGYREDLP